MNITRAIETKLTPGFPPVLVLEGARTTGKTFIARRLVKAGTWQHYGSLADAPTLQLAQADLPGWLESVSPNTIIDEAQLLSELPLQVKRLVDESSRRFLLTGSARIGRQGLGGSDPLTGRVRRWTLWPLTWAEISGDPQRMTSLSERLFTGELAGQNHEAVTVADRVTTGGFPLIALEKHDTSTTFQWIRDTTIGLLTDQIMPDEAFSAAVARRILDACLRNPGGILNIASLGQRLELNPRTIDRYLDILERRFLLHFLPNLATNPTRQTRARSKIHPIDTAFAVESLLRSQPEGLSNPSAQGSLFESYVVNQIVPCLQFSSQPVYAFYWRDAKTQHEVDLVLSDDEGHRVGIEMKSSSRVTLADTTGLRALDRAMGLTYSYVIYPGSQTVRLADRCWGVPVTTL